MEPSVHTSSASAILMAGRVLLCRYKPQSTISAQTVAENAEARKFLPGPDPSAEIVVIPENVRITIDLAGKELHRILGFDPVTRVKAWVAEGALFEKVGGLQLPQLPGGSHFKVFADLKEAVAWVNKMLAGSKA